MEKGYKALYQALVEKHYEFSQDREFLKNYTYPYVRELMDFWEDNLVLDDTGRYVIHGAARERDPGDLNPGSTLGIVEKVLKAAIHISRELGVDEGRRDLWCNYLERLSDYPTMVVDGSLCFSEAENRIVFVKKLCPGFKIDNTIFFSIKIYLK